MALQTFPLVATGSLTDRFRGLVNQFAERVDEASGRRLGRYLDRYAEVPQSKAFTTSSFGVHYALMSSTHIPLAETLREVAVFTIEEARERLQAFLDGSFVPESIQDLIEYLGEKFLRLETHSLKDGAVNYLVDTRSGASIAAHQVDPRLSHHALLQTRLREVMRQQFGAISPARAFSSWQGMMFATDDDTNGIGYTVSGKDAYYGRIYAVASTDPEKNRELLLKAAAAGVQLIVPTKPGDPPEAMVPGMPILRRVHSMKAASLNPDLSHESLSLAFGKSMFTAYEEMFERQVARASDADMRSVSVSLSDFHSLFLRRPEDDTEMEAVDDGLDAFDSPTAQRDLVIRRESSQELRLFVYDRDDEERIDISPSQLIAGEYVRETEYGVHEGFTLVNDQGRMIHFDLNRQRINLAVHARNTANESFDHVDEPVRARKLH
jgi:hypothetical protein